MQLTGTISKSSLCFSGPEKYEIIFKHRKQISNTRFSSVLLTAAILLITDFLCPQRLPQQAQTKPVSLLERLFLSILSSIYHDEQPVGY